MNARGHLRNAAVTTALLVFASGCGTTTGQVPPQIIRAESVPMPERKREAPPASARPAPQSALAGDDAIEQHWREHAEEFARNNRWGEAAAQWELLTLLRPSRPEYASNLVQAQARAASVVEESLTEAADARKRGDFQHATNLCLKALSADPQSVPASQMLRDIDREQSHKLYFNHAAIGGRAVKSARTPYSADRQELDAGIMLLHQGDYSGSVQSLQSYLKRDPRDEAGKRALREAYAALGKQRIEQGKKEEGVGYLEKARAIKGNGGAELDNSVQSVRKDLAQDYYEQALRIQRTDLDAAIRLLERSLENDPTHAQARTRLEQARRMQRNLKSIPDAASKP